MVIFLGYLTLILVGCTVGGTRRRVTHTPTTARLNTNRFHIYSFPHFLVACFWGGGAKPFNWNLSMFQKYFYYIYVQGVD